VDTLLAGGKLRPPLAVVGFSYGGAVGIQYAAADPRVRAVIAVATFSSLRGVLREYLSCRLPTLGPLVPEWVFDRVLGRAGQLAGFDPSRASPLLGAARGQARLLVIHGTEDCNIPVRHGRLICQAYGRRCQLLELRGEDHGVTFGQASATVKPAMAHWLERWMVD
jgi:dipeptidyl aminopeptidase/acylaminoacyl peptidase